MSKFRQKDFPKLEYDSETGEFTWLVTSSSKAVEGCVAGSTLKKFISIGYEGRNYRAHRLAWLFYTGSWPEQQIDHIDGNPHNNRISNLRDVSSRENQLNCKLGSRNTSGYRGVNYDKRRKTWYSVIYDNGKFVYLGTFKCKTAAVIKRKSAEIEYGYHENHGRVV